MAQQDRVDGDGAASWPAHHEPGHEAASELICLRGVLAPGLLTSAEQRARKLGVGADQVLIQWGLIDEAGYLERLAAHLGMHFDRLTRIDRDACALADHQLPFAARSSIVPLRHHADFDWIIAPRGLASRRLARLAAHDPALAARIALTTRHDLDRFLVQQGGRALAGIAADALRDRHPALSAGPPKARPPRRPWRLTGMLAVAAIAVWAQAAVADLLATLAAIWFLAFAVLRLLCAVIPRRRPHDVASRLTAADLPVYSILIALYYEARSIPHLMRALARLDYPPEKLDIIMVLEPDDLQTRAALARMTIKPQMQILIAPASGPKTKPKALNFALPFARGSFIAVYDAEDNPDPGQLRAALDLFRQHDDRVACAQASLRIDNLTHSWLSRMFATDYAGLFDVVLPGLSALGMPLPLGGSSNHFRASALREVGGWDAWNVTEDADLGFRLARYGYRAVTLQSTTLEEAPIHLDGWLRQRTRWMKGWLQTSCVHMRDPLALWRQTGARGVLSLNLVIGGHLLAALAFPVLLAELVWCFAKSDGGSLLTGNLATLHLSAIVSGLTCTLWLGLLGLARQRRLRDGWILALTPLYWGCVSIATWRAVWQFWTNRYHWEKTEHGLVRRAPERSRAAPTPATMRRRARGRSTYR